MPSSTLGIVSSAITFPTVSGGTLSSDATYYYRTFTTSGNLVISGGSLSGDVLLWGGGAGGKQFTDQYTGDNGSGAGFYRIITFSNTAAGTYAATVGAGGGIATNGSHSSMFGNDSGRGLINGFTVNFSGSAVFSPGNGNVQGYGGPGGAGAGGNGQDMPGTGFPGAGGVGATVWGTTRGVGGRGGYGYYAFTRVAAPVAGANTSNGGGGGSYYYDGNYSFGASAGGSGVVIVRYFRSAVGG